MRWSRCRPLSIMLAMALALAAALSHGAAADVRVALVVGNSDYQNVGRLANPIRDAQAIAEALKGLGFETTLVTDLDREALQRSLRSFAAKARGADIAAVYYAGHGMEAAGENYLIPVDAALKNDDDIEFELIPLDLVLHSVSAAKTLRLVILDACRNNPFAAQIAAAGGTRAIGRGFVRVEPANNTLVAYAAKDGTTADDGGGEHSPFATALLKHLPDPGVDVGIIFRQVRDDVLAATNNKQEPFIYGSLGGKPVYLASAAASPPAPAPAPVTQVDPKALDLSYWNAIQGTDSPALYESYLKKFPDGVFADVAAAKIEQLKAAAAQKEGQLTALAAPPPKPVGPVIEPLDGTYVVTRATAIRSEPATAAKVKKKLRIDDTVQATGRVKDADWLRTGEAEAVGYVPLSDLAATEDGEIAAWNALKKAPTLASAKEFQAQFPDSPLKERVAAIVTQLTPPPIEVESLDATYVAKQTANVRAEPNATAKLLGKLAPDAGVAVTGKVKGKDWLRVQQGAEAGYVSASQLAPIDASEIADWQALQAKPTFEGAQTYLQKHPAGYFKDRVSALANKLAPPPPTPPSPEIETLTGTYIATQAANLRAEPNASAKGLGKLGADDAVAVTGKVKDSDWYRLDREGQVAFVSAKLLQKIDENELKAWRQLTTAPKLEAAEAFIAQYPNGYFAPKAQVLKASLQPEQQPPKPASGPALAAAGEAPAEPSAPKIQVPAAIAPPPESEALDAIKVGGVYSLKAELRGQGNACSDGPSVLSLDGNLTVTGTAGDGKFIARYSGQVSGKQNPGDFEITKNGATIDLSSRNGRLNVSMTLREEKPGNFVGSGNGFVATACKVIVRGPVSFAFPGIDSSFQHEEGATPKPAAVTLASPQPKPIDPEPAPTTAAAVTPTSANPSVQSAPQPAALAPDVLTQQGSNGPTSDDRDFEVGKVFDLQGRQIVCGWPIAYLRGSLKITALGDNDGEFVGRTDMISFGNGTIAETKISQALEDIAVKLTWKWSSTAVFNQPTTCYLHFKRKSKGVYESDDGYNSSLVLVR